MLQVSPEPGSRDLLTLLTLTCLVSYTGRCQLIRDPEPVGFEIFPRIGSSIPERCAKSIADLFIKENVTTKGESMSFRFYNVDIILFNSTFCYLMNTVTSFMHMVIESLIFLFITGGPLEKKFFSKVRKILIIRLFGLFLGKLNFGKK